MTVSPPPEAEIARAVRARAEGTDWTARSGTVSARRHGIALHVYHFGAQLYFMAKPVSWDEIFWSIMRMSFKRAPSATRHWFGANCPVPRFAGARRDIANADKAARQTLKLAEKGARSIRPEMDWLPRNAGRPDDYVVAEVVKFIERGALSDALALCNDVISGRRKVTTGIHLAGVGSFFDLAASALDEGRFAT